MKYKIESLSSDGKGIVKINEKVHFVEATCPGDTIEPITIEDKANFGIITKYNLLEASKNRVEAPCQYFLECGGCSWQHIAYPTQLEAKAQIIKDALARIGKIKGAEDLEIECVASPKQYNYRNRTVLHVQNEPEAKIGYYMKSSNEIIDIDKCLLLEEAMEDAPKQVGEIIASEEDANADYAVFLDFKGMVQITKHDKDVDFIFSQVNSEVNKLLQEEIHAFVKVQKSKLRVLDLYCGNGNLSIMLAPDAQEILGYDISNRAISRANNLANKLGYTNAKYRNADITQIIKHRRMLKNHDLLIIDPPRSGAKNHSKDLAKLHIPTVIYVSCRPSTLARDLKHFEEEGYKLVKAKGFDMFPQTPHVEVVVQLERL